MKNKGKKLLSMLLAAVLLFGSMAVGGEGFSDLLTSYLIQAAALESTGNATFDAFINDSRFTNGISWGNIGPKLSTYSCSQCCAYAADFVKYCFGYNTPKAGEYFTGAANIRAGDVIVVGGENGGGHWFVCLKRSGNSLYVAEGNYAGKVRIGWNYTIVNDSTINGISYSFSHGWHYLAAHTCDYKAKAEIINPPTRTASGTRKRTCSCGKTMTETIPAIPYTTDLAEGIYTITTKCKSGLQVATNASSNYNVFIAEGNYADQYWLFRKNSDGTYTIENAYYNGKVLDVEGVSMVNDANIFAYDYHGGDNQKFYVIPMGNYYKLVAKNSYLNFDNYCARTTSGNNIIQYEDNGNDAQRWTLKKSNPPLNLSSSSVTVAAGSSITVNCTVGRDTYGVRPYYSIADGSVCSASWGNWNGMTCPLTITGKAGGTTTVTVTIKDGDTGIVYDTKTITVTVPDTTKPTISISSTNNVAASQTATLSLSDNVGLAGYYWGTSSTYSNNTYTSVSGTSKSVTNTVSEPGTYYLTAKDAAGNISSTVSKTFYETTLNPDTGSVSPTSVITMSGNSFTLPTPTRTGYTFLNWSTVYSGSGTAYTGSFKPSGNITLYAQWTPNIYTVTFNANGGTCSTESRTVRYNSTYGDISLSPLPTPTRTGYSFLGWFTAASGGNEITMRTKVLITADQTLYAHWTPNTYTVSFNANGGSCSTGSKTVTYDSTYGTLPTPTRTGYSFAGWYTASSGGSKVTNTTKVSITANQTLYAHWTANTSATITSTNQVANSQTVTLTMSSELGLDSYYWGKSSENPEFKAISGTERTETGSVTDSGFYYLKVKDKDGNTTQQSMCFFKTEFDSKGGSVSPACVISPCTNGYRINGSTGVRTYFYQSKSFSLPTPVRAGYTFQNWNSKSDGSGTSYGAGTSYSRLEFYYFFDNDDDPFEINTVLYAQWTPNTYTVLFNANGGSCSTSSKTVTYDSTYGALPTPTRAGYSFLGWFTAASGGAKVTESTKVSITANQTLYAHWTANAHTLTYNVNGGTGAPSDQSGNGTITLSNTKPTRDGYTFLGWATSASATKAQYAAGASFNLTENTTLYAVWEKIVTPTQPKVTKVEVNDVMMNYKDSVTLKPTITADPGADCKIKYESSNTKVAAVDANGKVTAAKRGTATVTVTVTDSTGNTVKDTCKVTVKYTVVQWIIFLLFGWLWY